MIPHLLIVDDEEDVLESLVPSLVSDLARRLVQSKSYRDANAAAGNPLPSSGRVNIHVSALGYHSAKLAKWVSHHPTHLCLHLCCEKGGAFRHALRLIKEHFFAVVVSDLRFSDDMAGARAGRLFIDDVQRRNPETFSILYSAYQKPDGFPAERFVRKGSASNLGGEELIDKMVEGIERFLEHPDIQRFAKELGSRGLVYQSESFGSMLKRLYDYAGLYFGAEPPAEPGRRRPRPTLLLDGETGTGKTDLAALLHQISDRREFPFVSASCGQLTDENLLRSTLFGHVKGSFTGAASDRAGLVQAAGRGILFLDDLHKLSDIGSVILHSFLDDGEYSHVGQDELRRTAEAGIVCAVETPRWEEIKTEERLTDSFIHRVEQLVLRVPPLRARPEDIRHQADHYTRLFGKEIGVEAELSPAAIDWLIDHGFPNGNSRKLRSFLRGLIASQARVTDFLDVPELEEYAADVGMTRSAATSAATPPAPHVAAAQAPAVPATSTPDAELSPWQTRMAVLARLAIADEYGLDLDAAEQHRQMVFDRLLPKLWNEFRSLVRHIDPARPMEMKLFDELFRCFAIHAMGSPAKAAKEMGIKDNALREFIYSRENKRGLANEE